MKPHYSEFVRHCLRFYVKTQDEGKGGHPIFRNEAEKANWSACYRALKNYSANDVDIICQIYRPGDTIPDKIYMLAKAKQVSQDAFWGLISRVERSVAKERGLV